MRQAEFSSFAPVNPDDEGRVETYFPMPPRAVVMFRSGAKLDLLNPHPDCWTDNDLAQNLARIARWGGATKWEFALSVAQHSLFVLAIAEAQKPLTPIEARRELLHDAGEGLLGWDALAPLKPELGVRFRNLEHRLQNAIDRRYGLAPWTEDAYARHKHADRLAAASEARHVVGWSREDMRDVLHLDLTPLSDCPIPSPNGFAPWEPWPPKLAERLFLEKLEALNAATQI